MKTTTNKQNLRVVIECTRNRLKSYTMDNKLGFMENVILSDFQLIVDAVGEEVCSPDKLITPRHIFSESIKETTVTPDSDDCSVYEDGDGDYLCPQCDSKVRIGAMFDDTDKYFWACIHSECKFQGSFCDSPKEAFDDLHWWHNAAREKREREQGEQ